MISPDQEVEDHKEAMADRDGEHMVADGPGKGDLAPPEGRAAGAVAWVARYEWLIAGCLLILSCCASLPFVLSLPGEADSARHFLRALSRHQLDLPHYLAPGGWPAHFPRYGFYTGLLRTSLDLGVPSEHMFVFWNIAGNLASQGVLLLLYALWRRWTDPVVALLAVGTYWFYPSFWYGLVYLLPITLGLCFILLSLLLFRAAVGRNSAALYLLCCVCLALGCFIKPDLLLSTAGLYGILIVSRKVKWRFAIMAGAIPAMAVLLFILFYQLDLGRMYEYFSGGWWVKWDGSAQRAFRFDALFYKEATGVVFAYLIGISIPIGLALRKTRRVVLFALLMGLPATFFWGMLLHNSARHLVASEAALSFLPVYVLASVIRSRGVLFALLTACVVTNYFSLPVDTSVYKRSTRLYETARMISAEQEIVAEDVERIRGIVDSRMAITGRSTNVLVALYGIASGGALAEPLEKVRKGLRIKLVGEGGVREVLGRWRVGRREKLELIDQGFRVEVIPRPRIERSPAG